jgi:hypothetical protein
LAEPDGLTGKTSLDRVYADAGKITRTLRDRFIVADPSIIAKTGS